MKDLAHVIAVALCVVMAGLLMLAFVGRFTEGTDALVRQADAMGRVAESIENIRLAQNVRADSDSLILYLVGEPSDSGEVWYSVFPDSTTETMTDAGYGQKEYQDMLKRHDLALKRLHLIPEPDSMSMKGEE